MLGTKDNVVVELSDPTSVKPVGGGNMIVTPHNRGEFLSRHVITRDDVFAVQTKNGRYRKVAKKLSDAALHRHLDHKITIGCYNSSLEGTCKFALIDVDGHEGNCTIPIETVQKRALKCILVLSEFKIPYTFAESSPGCYHIAVYFKPPAKTAEAYDFVRWITRNAGEPEIEVFPKQREVPAGEYGNLIRLPFSIHQKKRTSYHYVDESFHHIDEFVVEPIDISGFTVPDRMTPTAASAEDEPTRMKKTACAPLGAIPPCVSAALENGDQLTGGGGHYFRIAIVCAFRDVGLSHSALCRLFTGQDDYDAVETAKQVHSVLKKDGGYSYSCKTLKEKCPNFIGCGNCPWG